jgi:hypothetical protein
MEKHFDSPVVELLYVPRYEEAVGDLPGHFSEVVPGMAGFKCLVVVVGTEGSADETSKKSSFPLQAYLAFIDFLEKAFIVGFNSTARSGSSPGSIFNCYAAADITAATSAGAVTGYDNAGTYTWCFWDSDLNPDVNGIGNTSDPAVIAKTTTEMHTESTFTGASWDFTNIWTICDGTNYPRFIYQEFIAPDYLCPEGIDFFDYGFFASHWLLDNCPDTNDCNFTDLDLSGDVGPNDLDIFTSYWLFGK